MAAAAETVVLDVSGSVCPEPVMMLHKKIRDASAGAVIQIISTDPSTLRDIPKFCRYLRHSLLASEQRDGRYFFKVRKER